MTKRILGLCLAVVLLGGSAFAQQPASGSGATTKHRKILTAVGIGGGFWGGVFVGMGIFDDAVNSDRKVWTSVIVGAAAGGVGGYFLGRTMDRNASKKSALTISPIAGQIGKGVRVEMQF